MYFARIDLILKTHRMAKLIDRIDFAANASFNHGTYTAYIAIKQIHMMSVDKEPSTAVDAGTPRAERCHKAAGMPVIQFAYGRVKRLDRKWFARVIIYREINIGVFARRAASARAAKHYGLDARDRSQPLCNPAACFIYPGGGMWLPRGAAR